MTKRDAEYKAYLIVSNWLGLPDNLTPHQTELVSAIVDALMESDLEERIEKLEEDLMDARAERSMAEGDVEEMESQLDTAEEIIRDLKAQLAEARNGIVVTS